MVIIAKPCNLLFGSILDQPNRSAFRAGIEVSRVELKEANHSDSLANGENISVEIAIYVFPFSGCSVRPLNLDTPGLKKERNLTNWKVLG